MIPIVGKLVLAIFTVVYEYYYQRLPVIQKMTYFYIISKRFKIIILFNLNNYLVLIFYFKFR